jgi:hypothetical protein
VDVRPIFSVDFSCSDRIAWLAVETLATSDSGLDEVVQFLKNLKDQRNGVRLFLLFRVLLSLMLAYFYYA